MSKAVVAEYKRRSGQKWTRKAKKTPVDQLKPLNSQLPRRIERIYAGNNRVLDLTYSELCHLVQRRDEEGDNFEVDGYKFTDNHAYSLGRRQQFQVGRRYTMTTPVQMCKTGWHFSPNPLLAAQFFQGGCFNKANSRRLFAVRARGTNMRFGQAKFVTGDIEFKREIIGEEYAKLTTGIHQNRACSTTGFEKLYENGNKIHSRKIDIPACTELICQC